MITLGWNVIDDALFWRFLFDSNLESLRWHFAEEIEYENDCGYEIKVTKFDFCCAYRIISRQSLFKYLRLSVTYSSTQKKKLHYSKIFQINKANHNICLNASSWTNHNIHLCPFFLNIEKKMLFVWIIKSQLNKTQRSEILNSIWFIWKFINSVYIQLIKQKFLKNKYQENYTVFFGKC